MELDLSLIIALLIGGLGGLTRSIFHYGKKVMTDSTIQWDIGKAFYSVLRGIGGAALAGAAHVGANPYTIFMAGLGADVLGKDFWNYIIAYQSKQDTNG